MIKVTVWNEFRHEKFDDKVKAIYPDGIHKAIADFLSSDEFEVKTATLDMSECGLTEEVLKNTDVLLWWGHISHGDVPDEIAARVVCEVQRGMGIIFLHSAHFSKPFISLMGTTCSLSWREDGDYEHVWVCDPSHPIAKGINRFIKLDEEETYGEPFDIPEPDKLVFIGSYEGSEVFRSGCCWKRGYGNVFYFQPGHETCPTYLNPEIQTVIRNAVRWAYSPFRVTDIPCPHISKL